MPEAATIVYKEVLKKDGVQINFFQDILLFLFRIKCAREKKTQHVSFNFQTSSCLLVKNMEHESRRTHREAVVQKFFHQLLKLRSTVQITHGAPPKKDAIQNIVV